MSPALPIEGVLLVFSLVGVGCGVLGGGDDEEKDPPEPDTTAPTIPSNLSGDSEESAVVLQWNAVDAPDLDGYNVYRSTDSIGTVLDRSPTSESLLSESSYTDGDLENGTTYHYVVTAVDTADNESDPSSEITKTPFAEPPDRP